MTTTWHSGGLWIIDDSWVSYDSFEHSRTVWEGLKEIVDVQLIWDLWNQGEGFAESLDVCECIASPLQVLHTVWLKMRILEFMFVRWTLISEALQSSYLLPGFRVRVIITLLSLDLHHLYFNFGNLSRRYNF